MQGATLIPRLIVDRSGTIIDAPDTATAAHDVTGGVAAKLEAAATCAAMGIPAVIVQVGTAHATDALAGKKPDVCTIVECL